MPDAYPASVAAGRIGVYNVAYSNFDQQQRAKADIHAAICTSLRSITLNEFGIGSLSPQDLVRELKTTFGNISKQEIDATQALISAPHGHFIDIRDFCSTLHLNYEFLTAAGHTIPE
jgi:hypothetical protein